jgi:hypothetical protein
MRVWMVAIVLGFTLLADACANAPDPKPDRDAKPEGKSWFCSTEVSGML